LVLERPVVFFHFETIEAVVTMLRSNLFIETVHTAISVFMSSALGLIFYKIIADRNTILTWISMIFFLMEGVVLNPNGWKCPLTTCIEKLVSSHGQITDMFLPEWFADKVFKFIASY
jgi:hypothetical protein